MMDASGLLVMLNLAGNRIVDLETQLEEALARNDQLEAVLLREDGDGPVRVVGGGGAAH